MLPNLENFKKSLIYLTGFMGSGKSTVGEALAQALNFIFFDLDKLIEQKMSKSIADIFKDEGSSFFRIIESEILKDISQESHAVVALGGGTLLEPENFFLVKEKGLLIWLSAEIPEIWKRVSVLEKRHLLEVKDSKENMEYNEEMFYQRIEHLLMIRKPHYEEAEFFIDTTNKSIEQIVNEIVFKIKAHGPLGYQEL